ncbi:Cuticle protein 16.8 [Nymphon striatum]|nr:Cuticle protein 16.8 [Nymphon striatum]
MENGCLVPDWFDGPVIPADLFHDKEDTDVDTGDQQAVDDAEYDDGSSTDSEWSDDSATIILALAAVSLAQYHGAVHKTAVHSVHNGSPGYGHDSHAVHATHATHGYAAPAKHAVRPAYSAHAPSYKQDDYEEAKPYEFGFNTKDEYDTQINRQESGDGYGNVKGSYGYTDAYGLYRQVEYTADDYGFKAQIKTNEPGTANQNPADVQIYADPAESKYEAPKKGYNNAHKAVAHAPSYGHKAVVAHAPSYGHGAVVAHSGSYAAPSYGHRASYAAPSYGHRASYAAPAYGHQASYAGPAHKTAHVSTHRRGYDDKKGGYGHDSHVTTHSAGYRAPVYNAAHAVHSQGYAAPARHGITIVFAIASVALAQYTGYGAIASYDSDSKSSSASSSSANSNSHSSSSSHGIELNTGPYRGANYGSDRRNTQNNYNGANPSNRAHHTTLRSYQPKPVAHRNIARPSYSANPINRAHTTSRSYQPKPVAHRNVVRPSYSAQAPSYKQEEYESPKPYHFAYNIKDDYDTQIHREESGDEAGNVQGTYGYIDANGLYRQVEYTAGEYGFRANIKTNEPGTASKNPADVEIYADPIEVSYENQKQSYGNEPKILCDKEDDVCGSGQETEEMSALKMLPEGVFTDESESKDSSGATIILALVAVTLAQYHGAGRKTAVHSVHNGNPGYGHDSHAVHATHATHGYAAPAKHAVRPAYSAHAPSYKQDDYKQNHTNSDFNTKDEYDTQINRQESGDGYGNVKGSYGYQDAYGIYRQPQRRDTTTHTRTVAHAPSYGHKAVVAHAPSYGHGAVVAHSGSYAAPAYGHRASYAAPSYGHQASYAAPSYGHQASYTAPVHKTAHASSHRRGYDAKKGGYGHDSHVTTHSAGYRAPVHHAAHAVHSQGYAAPARHGVSYANTHQRGYDSHNGGYGHASHVVAHKTH